MIDGDTLAGNATSSGSLALVGQSLPFEADTASVLTSLPKVRQHTMGFGNRWALQLGGHDRASEICLKVSSR
jgi:hypothetical protein